MRCPWAFSTNQIVPALIFQKKPQSLPVCDTILDWVSPCFLYLWRPRTRCSCKLEQRKRVTSLNSADPAAQDTVSYLWHTSVWPAYGQLVIHLDLEVFLCRSAFQLASLLDILPWYSFPSTGLCIFVTVLPAQFSSLSSSGWQHNRLVHQTFLLVLVSKILCIEFSSFSAFFQQSL